MWLNLQFSADLDTFTEEILNGKLHFLYGDWCFMATWFFLKHHFINCVPFLYLPSKECFIWNKNYLHYPKRLTFSQFHLFSFVLFAVWSCFWLVLVYFILISLFRVVPLIKGNLMQIWKSPNMLGSM